MGFLEDVESLYKARPYPEVGIFSAFLQKVAPDNLILLNYLSGFASCYGNLGQANKNPKILVAGCGTFEPVAVAMANPNSEIWAVDLSETSLQKLRWQLRARGLLGRVKLWKGDFQKLPENNFDYVIATGVLHHLEDPEKGLQALIERTAVNPVFRFMIYSKWGRSLLYGAKEMAEVLKIKDPSQFRKFIDRLPADHPYRIYFYLYSDAKNDTGLADGYLHPCDSPFSALDLESMLIRNGLFTGSFLHRHEGQPKFAEEICVFDEKQNDWQKIALLDALGQLEENFCFFAGVKPSANKVANHWIWNPILPKRGNYFSKLLGRYVAFDQSKPWQEQENIRDLQKSFFLLPEIQ
jgi:hypothetical protein